MNEKDKIEFEKAIELRNFEISNFWRRGWFFGALILATTSGYFTNISMEKQVPPICISFLLLWFFILQSLMNRGSKYWQERWEYVTKNRETKLKIDLTNTNKYNGKERYYLDQCILAKKENWLVRAQRISVSKLTFLVWDIICISSFLLWLNDILIIFSYQLCDTWKILIFHIFIIVYIFCFCIKGNFYENIKKTKKQMGEDERTDKSQTECNMYVKDKIIVDEN